MGKSSVLTLPSVYLGTREQLRALLFCADEEKRGVPASLLPVRLYEVGDGTPSALTVSIQRRTSSLFAFTLPSQLRGRGRSETPRGHGIFSPLIARQGCGAGARPGNGGKKGVGPGAAGAPLRTECAGACLVGQPGRKAPLGALQTNARARALGTRLECTEDPCGLGWGLSSCTCQGPQWGLRS